MRLAAIALQERLAPQVVRTAPSGFAPKVTAGLDVAYGTVPGLFAFASCQACSTRSRG